MEMKQNMEQKTAFLAIVGCPNVGKSSLLNALLGQKIAIVSNKPQTTRTRIMGIYTKEELQLVFIDTPGLHKAHNRLDEYMERTISHSVAGVDACILVVEAGAELREGELQLIEKIKAQDIPAILVINKIDRLANKEELMAQIAAITEVHEFEAVVPLSALRGDGIKDLHKELAKMAMPGDHFFDEDEITDMPEKTLVAEIIREKLLRLTSKEIPHGTAVVVEQMKEKETTSGEPLTDIMATIFCERDSHKGIIIGKSGAMLKKVGSYAREDLEKFFECKINLQLWVKVKENWRNQEALLHSFGYDKNDFEQ